jgi:hypothetical protein
MGKGDLARLFEIAAERALKDAGLPPSGDLGVEFHGTSIQQNPITMQQTVDLLWLGPDRFYVVVDVGVLRGGEGQPVLFVRPSGHEPGPLSSTWRPDDLGPFKSIGLMR